MLSNKIATVNFLISPPTKNSLKKHIICLFYSGPIFRVFFQRVALDYGFKQNWIMIQTAIVLQLTHSASAQTLFLFLRESAQPKTF